MGIFHKNRRQKKSRSCKPKLRQIEMLEDRRLMAVVTGESTFDPDTFIQNMDDLYAGNAMGYAYAVNYNGVDNAAHGFDGLARTTADSPQLNFHITTKTEVASVSKIATTVALLQLLDNLPGTLDAALDRPLNDFIPSDWTPGVNVGWVTMRHLLRHTSGFKEGDTAVANNANGAGINFNSFGNNTFANVQALVQADIPTDASGPFSDPQYIFPRWNRSYNNANFTLIAKVVIPKLIDPNQDFSAAGLAAIGVTANDVDQYTGEIYSDYMIENVFEPSSIFAVSMDVTEGSTNNAYAYSGPSDATGGIEIRDELVNGGAFGWKLSARQLARFLDGMRHNDAVLSPTARQLMDAENLGWAPQSGGDVSAQTIINTFGQIYGHGGSRSGGNGEKFHSEVMVLPGDVEVAVVINSDRANLPGGGIQDTVHVAYMNAWSEISFEGSEGDDVFEVRVNTSGAQDVYEIALGGNVVYTQWVDTLHALTINGLGGNDQFIVDELPPGFELVLNGDAGNDTWLATPTSGNLELINGVTFNGGANVDTVVFNDAGNPYSHPDSNSYFLGADQVHRLGGTQGNVISVDLFLKNVEHSTLTTGSQGDWVEVLSTGWTTTLNLGNGNDTVGGASDFKNIETINGLVINGGNGIDTVSLNDENNPYSHPLSAQYSASSESVRRYMDSRALPGQPVQVDVEIDSVETLNLTTGEQGDVVVIENMPLLGGTIDTGAGDDVVMTTSGNLEDVDGLVIESGKGEDQVLLDDSDNPYVHPFGNIYQVTSEDVFRPSTGQSDGVSGVNVYFYDNEHLTLDSGKKGDIVSVHSVAWSTTLNTGDDNDSVLAAPNSRDMEMISGLVVNGGAGQDYVAIDDDNNPYTHVMSNRYSASAERVSRYGTIGLSGPQHSAPEDNPMLAIEVFVDINSVETLDLVTGDEGDVVGVSSTTLLGTTIETGNGHDVVTTLSEMADVNGLVLDLGYGEDTLLVTDSANPYSDPTDNQYELDSSSVQRGSTSPATIMYSDLEHLQVVTGEHADLVELLGGGELSTQLFTSGGDDTIHASPVSENLEDVAGMVVDGGAGEDELLLHDRANPYSHAFSRNYVVTPESTSRSKANPVAPAIALEVEVAYSQLETLRLEAGNGNDLIQVEGAASQMDLSLYANNGSDQVVVNGPVFAAMHLQGDNPTHAPGDTLQLNVPNGSSGTHLPNPGIFGAGDATIDDAVIHYSEFEEVNTQLPSPTKQGDLTGDFDGNAIVNGDDLDNPVAGWKNRYGTNLDGSSFLAWQRNFGKKVASEASNNEIVIPVMASAEQELAEEEPAVEELAESLFELPENRQPIGGIHTAATDLYFSMLPVNSDGGAGTFEDTVMQPIRTESVVSESVKTAMPSITGQSISAASTLDYQVRSDYQIDSLLADDSIFTAVFDEYDPLAMPRL